MGGIRNAFLIATCGVWLAGSALPAVAQTEPVRRAQQRLDALGLAPGPIDGVMGSRTREALRAFQRGHDLPETGELDWQTRLALSATVRVPLDGPAAPVPKAVPVPSVTVAMLPPPQLEAPPQPGAPSTQAADPAVPDAATTAPKPDRTAAVSQPNAQPQQSPLSGPATAGAAAAAPAQASPNVGIAQRLAPALALGAAAASAWTALVVWWFRQRPPQPPAHENGVGDPETSG